MLSWNDVTFAYEQSGKNDILQNASLTIEPGRVTVLTGASGCGKSTLLYLACGLYPKNAGVVKQGGVTIGGRDVSAIFPEERARLVCMMFQNPDLQFCMDTVKNELVFCLENVRTPPEEMDVLIDSALSFCNITHLKDRLLVTLSGGEKQKALLACMVALRPKWLLLDEPFANIDPAAARQIANKLQQMRDQFGTGIVAVDHHLDNWTDIADEVIVIERKGVTALRGVCPQNLPLAELEKLGVSAPSLPYQTKKPAKPGAPEPILKLRDVCVTIGGQPILSGLDAQFYRGRIHAVTGASGSGKSTLFGALCGLHRYDGSIELCGRELKKTRPRSLGRLLGFVFQNPQDQFVSGSVLGEITTSLKTVLREPEIDAEAERILRATGLWRYRFVSPYMLSQGQQRRLAVAALLAYRCELLVCDEPTYAQDRNSLRTLMAELQSQVADRGLTLIFSTHDEKLAREYADHTYRLEGGRLYEITEPGV